MHPELKCIQSNDHVVSDGSFSTLLAEPWDGSGWFTVEIGPDDGIQSGELFQVFVVTPAALPHVKSESRNFRYVISTTLEHDDILSALHKHLTAISANSWADIRERLRKFMWWERESIIVPRRSD